MVSFGDLPRIVFTVGIAVMFGGAIALTLAEFRKSLSTGTQTDIIDNGTEAIANITEQLPVAGTIVGVSLIIVVVAGLFVIFGRGRGEQF
jgi:limonene-1,2-epoxide hydrolase